MEATNLCSCCLVNSPHKSLTMPYIYFGTTEVFLDVLEECFQIQLTLDNEDGGGICEECVGRLRDASDFKRQVQRCQAKMLARRARRETIVLVKDEEPFLEMADDIETCDEPVSNEEPLLEMADDSGTCKEPVSNEETLAPSEAPVDDATSEEGVISLSWRGTAGAVARPARLVTRAMARPARLVTRAKKQLATTCSVRLERLRSAKQPSSLTTHIEKERDDSFKADAKETYICDTCGKQCKLKMHLINHMRSHMIRNSSVYTSNLKDFMVIVPGKKPYGCKVCNKQFKIKYCLSRHTVVHTKVKSFKCDICNKLFKYKHDLTRHVIIHTGKKPYSCNLCDKSFTQKTGLNQHMAVHTGLRPYICPICYKTFTLKQLLNNHIRIHTGQKPYSCEICKKAFTERGQLRAHTRVHTGQRPYSCEICNRKFSQKVHVAFHCSRVHM